MLTVWEDRRETDTQRRWALKTLFTTLGLPSFAGDGGEALPLYIYDIVNREELPAELQSRIQCGACCVAIGGRRRGLEQRELGFVFWTGQDELGLLLRGKIKTNIFRQQTIWV